MDVWVVIINLKSGKKHFRQQIDYLFQQMKKNKLEYISKITQFAGHANLIAKNYLQQGYTRFLVVGGDGTVSEVINGLFSSAQPSENLQIGLIPRGTGNDWARYWGLTKDYNHAIDVFLKGKLHQIDIGKVNYHIENEAHTRFFINSIGFGLDAAVAQKTNHLKKFLGSHSILYTLALLAAVFRFRSKKIHISCKEKEIRDEMFTMNIANACFSGGGMKQNPFAVPDDGMFDVMFAGIPTFRDILSALVYLFRGKILEHPVIQSFRTKELELSCDNNDMHESIFEADGIVNHCSPPLKISVLPGAIQMIVP